MSGETRCSSAGGHQRVVADAMKERGNRQGEERRCIGVAEAVHWGSRGADVRVSEETY